MVQENGNSQLELRPLDIERGERLLYRLTEFGRLLWESDINVGPHQILELAETLDLVDITNKEEFYYTLKCCLLTKHEKEPIFDQMFTYYWLMRDRQNKKDKERGGAAKREERQMRIPPSERKRLAEHLNAPDSRKELRQEMRPTERRQPR